MDEESVLFQKRLEELAHKSYTNSQYLFTGFLSLAEQDVYHRAGIVLRSCYHVGRYGRLRAHHAPFRK